MPGLSSVLTACGGNEDSSTPTTTSSEASGDTGKKSSGESSGGNLEAFCALDSQLNSEVFSTYIPGQELTEEQTALLEEAKETAPDAISAQVSSIVDVLTGADPTSAESNETLSANENEIDAFVTDNC
ncbi:MAG: hypothetical protein FJW94_12995 [Actinobacteria bacterium]|nr:hypothetical protein [Actinomycetota bacterium]